MEEPSIKSRVWGGSLLVAGSCIGAAMLGLPALTARSGFLPSECMFFIAWAFMLATGLLLLEVNLWFEGDVSIITMVEKTLGSWAKGIAWITYLFLFYTLMVALISGSGEVLSVVTANRVAPEIFEVALAVCFGCLVWRGRVEVDYLNRVMMLGLILCYASLLFFGSRHVDGDLLGHTEWSTAWMALPVMIISFGFHNLVPSLVIYMERRWRPLVWSLFWGSAGAFLVYLLWQWLVLGIVSVEEMTSGRGDVATTALRQVAGTVWVAYCAEAFGFLAMTTTFLGVALGVVDFLADGLRVESRGWKKAALCLVAVLPPLLLSSTYPQLFLTALRYAGSFGAVILFGILPPWMVWRGRYHLGMKGRRLLPGGRPVLLLLLIFSLLIVALEVFVV